MLTKNSFPLTHPFLCYQTLENMKNYLYPRFSIETNKTLQKKKTLEPFFVLPRHKYKK